jgi:Flp pilus assembly protein TadB
VPLSEDEQRILRQIEQELASDPSFAQRGYRVSRRRLVVLSLALVVGLVLTVAGLTVSFLLAFAAFVGVLIVAFLLESEIRVLGREKIGNLPINAWLTGSGPKRPSE